MNSSPSPTEQTELSASRRGPPTMHSRDSDEDDNDVTWHPFSQRTRSLVTATSSRHHFQDNGIQEDVGQIRKQKRGYRFINRSKKVDTNGNKKNWIEENNSLTEKEWRSITCCKSWKCFSNCDIPFLLIKVRLVLTMSQNERRNFLHAMLTSDGHFSFNNRRVCSEFLSRSFRFSRDLQCSIKGTNGCKSKRSLKSLGSPGSNTAMEAIICFLKREVELSSNLMPDSDEVHLPYKLKEHVYKRFVDQYSKLNSTTPPSKNYFLSIWKQKCRYIKVRKHTRFSICPTCEQIDAAINKNMKSDKHTEQLLRSKKQHMDFVLRERCEYRQKAEKAKLFPSKYLSIIIDGADQSAFGLPHFCSSTKDQRGHSLKVRLVGVLDHAVINRLLLMTLTQEYESGANHIIEAIHRYLVIRSADGDLPKILYVQMDNCTRENKNRYLMAYLECLVSWGLFESIEVGFLPIGHTHEDIDQAFSATSKRLRSNNAITLEDLHNELRQTYNEKTVVISMQGVINFSGLCENSDSLRDVPPFSHYRYFMFSRCSSSSANSIYQTICHVKVNSIDDWTPLQSEKESHTFMTGLPKLSNTPVLIIPSNLKEEKFYKSKDEFTIRLKSEETRINDSTKYKELHLLKDKVFEVREEPFHWDLSRCPELMNVKPYNQNECKSFEGINNRNEEHSLVDSQFDVVENDYTYELNSFVAVRPEDTGGTPFWIGKISKLYKNWEGKISALQVHWYVSIEHGNPFTGKYKASFIQTANRPPWTDKVHSDSVILNFNKLNADGKLPSAIHKRLRSNH